MLQQIRQTFADSIILRIFLGAIIVSFIVWGVNDMLKGPSYRDIATFDQVSPITFHDFVQERELTFKRMQQGSETPLNTDQIDNNALNNSVLQSLVTNKLLAYIAKLYDINFSDTIAVNFIKTLDIFMNESNEFDPEKFKQIIKAEGYTESGYSEQIKAMITRGIIMSSLVGNAYLPNARINNIISHMSEIRTLDMASINLPTTLGPQAGKATEQDLLSFYNENNDMFKSEEMRDICYATITSTNARDNLPISDEEISNFYDENKADFKEQPFSKVKNQIRDSLSKQRSETGLVDLSKMLVDEVAGGASLQEIADKYHLKRLCEKNVTPNNIETRADGLFANFTEQISDMADKDLSYPLELPNQGGFVLLEITKVSPEHTKPFEEIKQEVGAKYAAFTAKQQLLQKLQNIAAANDIDNFAKNVAALGMTVTPKTYIRAELYDDITMPYEMVSAIFATNSKVITGPFIAEDKVYIFALKKAGYDGNTKSKLAKSSKNNIMTKLQEAMFEELTAYAQKSSNMKLKTDLKEFAKTKEE